MKLTSYNMMIQWVTKKTKHIEGLPSRFDLIFTVSVDLKRGICYVSPLEMNNHVLMEMGVLGVIDGVLREKHR